MNKLEAQPEDAYIGLQFVTLRITWHTQHQRLFLQEIPIPTKIQTKGAHSILMDLGKRYHQLKHGITFHDVGFTPKMVVLQIGILPWQIHWFHCFPLVNFWKSKATFSPVHPWRHPWCVVHYGFFVCQELWKINRSMYSILRQVVEAAKTDPLKRWRCAICCCGSAESCCCMITPYRPYMAYLPTCTIQINQM